MKAETLLETLLSQEGLDHSRIQAVYDALPEDALLTDFRHALVDEGVMSYVQVMKVFIHKTLLPKSQKLLKKIKIERKKNVHFKPKAHKQKFHIADDDQLISEIEFSADNLHIKIPSPDLSDMHFQHSDEKQAVMLAVEMVDIGELSEAEIILLETLDSFTESSAAITVLCWVYLSTGHASLTEHWAKSLISSGRPDQRAMELLCLAEQVQNKHLVASAHYQKLIRLKRVKSIWYLLMAYSQEHANCLHEAEENYHIYNSIGRDDRLKQFARHHLQELSH